MKYLTYFFSLGVLGVVFSLGMTVYAVFEDSKKAKLEQANMINVPVPAIN